MNQTIRSVALAATLSLAVASCTTGEGEGHASPSPGPHGTPLSKLDEVSLSGDPMAASDVEISGHSTRPLGEVHLGDHRIVSYLTGKKCGVSVFNAKKSEVVGLRTAWPEDSSEGSNKLPGGPYFSSSASSAVKSDPWVSLSCGENSMIIEYESKSPAGDSRLNGSISVKRSKGKHTQFVVIGSAKERAKILAKLP
ncbi:hypothetical protein [Streptomyces sp. NPDC047071]|uniref:hypothetical protein n=1 Tax=Streptomyces sp. NPDC047071 TaxID=3154808 RepID=UPI00345414E4